MNVEDMKVDGNAIGQRVIELFGRRHHRVDGHLRIVRRRRTGGDARRLHARAGHRRALPVVRRGHDSHRPAPRRRCGRPERHAHDRDRGCSTRMIRMTMAVYRGRSRRSSRSARGQHFLRRSRLAAALVRDARIARDDLVVDVGAGTGMLTRALSTQARAWSRSNAMRPLAAGLASGSEGHLGRRSGRSGLDPPDRAVRGRGEPPFAGSGAILSRLLRGPVTHAVVIVEWAFAQKQAAVWPTTLKSAYWRASNELELARRLDRTRLLRRQCGCGGYALTRRTDPLVATGEGQGTGSFCLARSTQGRKSGGACSRRFR